MLEKYFIFLYILTFFLLVAIIFIYKDNKKIKKWIFYVVFTILIIQMFIIYNTYPYVEHFDNDDEIDGTSPFFQNNKKLLDKVIEQEKLFVNTTGLGKVWVETNKIHSRQEHYYKEKLKTKMQYPILDIINKNTGKEYNQLMSFDPSKNPLPLGPHYMKTFNGNQIFNIMNDVKNDLSGRLVNIAINTAPKKDDKIKDYYEIR